MVEIGVCATMFLIFGVGFCSFFTQEQFLNKMQGLTLIIIAIITIILIVSMTLKQNDGVYLAYAGLIISNLFFIILARLTISPFAIKDCKRGDSF